MFFFFYLKERLALFYYRGRLRAKSCKLTFLLTYIFNGQISHNDLFLSNVSPNYACIQERNAPVSRQILLVPSLEVRDRLVDSEINKLLHVFSNKTRPRQSSAHMISLKVS